MLSGKQREVSKKTHQMYQNCSEEGRNKKRQYARERFRNLPEYQTKI